MKDNVQSNLANKWPKTSTKMTANLANEWQCSVQNDGLFSSIKFPKKILTAWKLKNYRFTGIVEKEKTRNERSEKWTKKHREHGACRGEERDRSKGKTAGWKGRMAECCAFLDTGMAALRLSWYSVGVGTSCWYSIADVTRPPLPTRTNPKNRRASLVYFCEC